MMLEEANARLKHEITNGELEGLNSLYILLDLEKDEFCKIVNAIGVAPLLKKQRHYDRLYKAEEEYTAKERYLAARIELEEINHRQKELEAIVKQHAQYMGGVN